jgi:hypothetical protein
MEVRLRICTPVALAAVLMMGLVAGPASPAANAGLGHTKEQAELNLLRVAAQSQGHGRIPDVIDARTGLLKDNVRSICSGRGRVLKHKRFRRFACILRPWRFQVRQELHVTYRALSDTRFHLRWARITRQWANSRSGPSLIRVNLRHNRVKSARKR